MKAKTKANQSKWLEKQQILNKAVSWKVKELGCQLYAIMPLSIVARYAEQKQVSKLELCVDVASRNPKWADKTSILYQEYNPSGYGSIFRGSIPLSVTKHY
jgi:hypothetical protein